MGRQEALGSVDPSALLLPVAQNFLHLPARVVLVRGFPLALNRVRHVLATLRQVVFVGSALELLLRILVVGATFLGIGLAVGKLLVQHVLSILSKQLVLLRHARLLGAFTLLRSLRDRQEVSFLPAGFGLLAICLPLLGSGELILVLVESLGE